MSKLRTSTNSIVRVFGTMTYNDTEVINIFKKISINKTVSDIRYYDEYVINDFDRWDSISQKFYSTPNLWWLIAAYNSIKNPFTSLVAGNKIRIIKPTFVPGILIQLKG